MVEGIGEACFLQYRHHLLPLGHHSDGACYLDLLADAVDQEELALGEEDRQRNAWEAPTGTEVQEARPWLEANHLCDP